MCLTLDLRNFEIHHDQSISELVKTYAMYVIGLYVLLLFLTQLKAKLTDDPHDMRMEDFEISRKQWNKKEMRYILKFSRSGEVIKTSDACHRPLRFAPLDIHGDLLWSSEFLIFTLRIQKGK